MLIPQVTPIQPINVIVHQAPGWPTWLTTLFSASVGAVFGIVGNIFMEYVRPRIQRSQTIKVMLAQLQDEVIANLRLVLSALRVCSEWDHGTADNETELLAMLLDDMVVTDRYDHYFRDEKALLYAIDEGKFLYKFYRRVGMTLRSMVKRKSYYSLKSIIEEAANDGRQYCETKGIAVDDGPTLIDEICASGDAEIT